MSRPDLELPKATVGRLSLYLRELETWERDGHATISSRQLAKTLGATDAQVRKDLACCGSLGRAGVGYRVADLRTSLRQALGVEGGGRLALIGVGNLGRALLGYQGFRGRGFDIAAAFDRDPVLAGQRVGGVAIQPLAELAETARRQRLELFLLAVPAEAAQSAAAAAQDAGAKGLLNFAPTAVKVSPGVTVVDVDLGLLLEQLVYLTGQTGRGR